MYGIKVWRVHCLTCGHVETQNDVEPTECPNNGGHTIEPAKTVCLINEAVPITKVFDMLDTTDDTQGILQEVEIPDDSIVIVEASVVGFRTDDVDDAAYVVRAAVRRRSGGDAAIVGSVDPVFTAETDATWVCTISVNGTTARVLVTGAVGKDITWSGRCCCM